MRSQLFYQWQRKLLALITALIIWLFVNHSITSTKIIGGVPIRVINLPANKTIQGMQPNGFLAKRVVLTLTGTKDVIDQLEPGDIEVILDIANQKNESVLQVTKKNLISLNPSINLSKHLLSVSHPEIIIKMSPLLTEQIPIKVCLTGESPPGYEFLDVWPSTIMQTVSGPQEQVLNLKQEGMELTLNLNDITQEQLDASQSHGPYNDEVGFKVPEAWKKITIPFQTRGAESLNDPEAKQMQVFFLKKQLIPIKNEIPIHIFYPLQNSAAINPDTFPLRQGPFVKFDHHIPTLSTPLFAMNASQIFIEIVRQNMEIQIVAVPKTQRERLEWSVGFIDEPHVQDVYIAFMLSNQKGGQQTSTKQHEKAKHFKRRFQAYMERFQLYQSPNQKLELESSLDQEQIRIYIPQANVQEGPTSP